MIKTYYPVCLTLVMVGLLAAYTAFYRTPFGNVATFLQDGLGFFFCVFAFFKLLNPLGFQKIFVQYDTLAKRLPIYGFIYPFIEFGLGLAFLLYLVPTDILCGLAIVLILFRAIGVVGAMRGQQSIHCGCMGTTALFPINWTTIGANIATIAAALALMILR
jgi:hypothetical protein